MRRQALSIQAGPQAVNRSGDDPACMGFSQSGDPACQLFRNVNPVGANPIGKPKVLRNQEKDPLPTAGGQERTREQLARSGIAVTDDDGRTGGQGVSPLGWHVG